LKEVNPVEKSTLDSLVVGGKFSIDDDRNFSPPKKTARDTIVATGAGADEK